MALSENTRISLSVATVVSVVGGILICGVTWGIYSTRLEALEANAEEIRKESRDLERQQTKITAQFEEIIRRLERLDRKLDWYETRQRESENVRNRR